MSVITSTIKLYKDSEITPSRNFVVEDLDVYLATLTKITISSFQYLRNDLRLTIKINKDQVYTESLLLYNYNYLEVKQQGQYYYYFILKKTQISQSTIALELLMDTCNTFSWNGAFYPTKRTRVIREHKDRIKKYVYQLTFNELQTASWSIGEAFPYTDGTPFIVNVELFTSGSDPTITNAYAQYYEAGAHKKLIITGINIDDGLSLVDDLEINMIRVYDEDYIMYATIYDLEDVNIDVLYHKIRNIDYYSEGINPVLYKEELGILDNTNGLEWNLIYRNHAEGDNVAIDCFCLPSYGNIRFDIPDTNHLTYTDFEDGKHYLFAPFTSDYYNLTDNDGAKWPIKINGLKVICKDVYRSGTTLKIRSVIYGGFINADRKLVIAKDPDIYDWKTITSLEFDNMLGALYYKASSIPNPVLAQILEANGVFTALLDTTEPFATLQEVDRADPKLIKIISIPYFPSTYTYDPSTYTLATDETWVFETSVYHSLELNNLNAQFVSSISSDVLNPLDVFELGAMTPNLNGLRDDRFESKLYHSEFYQPKFVYDSFGFVFEMEKVNERQFTPSTYFDFEFIMTSTINSKFMFKFPSYVLKMSTQDYDNVLPIARNNEAPIYNSSYITYLRTAYRYDLKNLGQKEARVYFGAVKDTFEQGMSVVKSYYSGGSSEEAGASFLFGITKTIFDGITQLNANEWSMEQKIEQLKNQSVSVSGSDDLDLMQNYAGNKAKLCLYKPSERMSKMVADLFYYFGYATNEVKIPNLHTRYWFNYIECELEITGMDKNITEVIKEDIKDRYRNGITVLHNNSAHWDFDQVKENWETNILEED